MIHIIPPGEDHLHSFSEKCRCKPIVDSVPDPESGEMLCTHLPLTIDIQVGPKEQKEMDDLFG